MYRLNQNEYKNVEHIFKELGFNIVIKSVIEGNTPGEIYVDNKDNPQVALTWDMMAELLIEGKADNDEVNMEINGLIIDYFKPRAAKRYIPCFDLYYSQNFKDKLQILLPQESCKSVNRNVYKFERLKVDWRELIPGDFKILVMDETLLKRSDLKHIDAAKGWVDSFWHSASDLASKGIGYCLLREDEVVSWCLSVFVSGRNYEFGLETVEEYRGYGYGKIAAAACMEYCIDNNLIPFWQCDAENIPSNKIAECVGFKKDFQYSVEHFEF